MAMAVYKDIRLVNSKKLKRKIEKYSWHAEGSFVDRSGKKQRYMKRGFDSEDAAQDWERKLLLQSKSLNVSGLLFEDVTNLYLNKIKLTSKIKSQLDILGRLEGFILPYFGKYKIQKIDIALINKWQEELLNKKYTRNKTEYEYSNEYLKTIQDLLKTVFKFSIKYGYSSDLQTTNFDNIYHKNQPIKEMKVWSPKDFNKFITAVDDLQYKALFCILYFCGLRIGEADALKWKDISLETREIKIYKTFEWRKRVLTSPKTKNSYRTVIMPKYCLNALREWYEYCLLFDGFDNEKYIFGFDTPLDDNTIRRRKDTYAKKAGVEIIRLHDFRHSHVSLLISQGFSAFDIAKRLGHTPEMVNNVYGHWFDDSQKKMVDKLDQLF